MIVKDGNQEIELEKIIEASLKFWEATRINGASASMADRPGVCSEIVKAFDKVVKLKSERQQ